MNYQIQCSEIKISRNLNSKIKQFVFPYIIIYNFISNSLSLFTIEKALTYNITVMIVDVVNIKTNRKKLARE